MSTKTYANECPVTCDGGVSSIGEGAPQVSVGLTHLVVGHAFDDRAGHLLAVAGAHVELDALRRQGLVTGARDYD